jgi:hypothetical protein
MALTPQQQQILNAIDMANSSGDAWSTIGPEGVIAYMQDSLRKQYGTDDLSKIRYVEDPNVPGGYRLDWEGRQPATGFLSGIKNASRSFGITQGTLGGAAGDAGDGLGTGLAPMNPSDALSFGATWEGKGGTTFSFYRKPDGSLGIKTASANSNDKGDIIAGIATVLGGMAMGGALGGAAAGGAGAAGAGAAEGAAAAGAAGGAGTAAGTAGLIDLGGGLAMTADGAIVGSTMAGGAGMSGAALDALITGAGFGAPGAAGAAGVAGMAGGGGGAAPAAAASGGGFNLGSAIKSGAASLFGGGGGGGAAGAAGAGGWTSLISPALSLVGGAYNAYQAGEAADAQIAAGDRGIAENRRQFDTVRELLKPYVDAGTGALGSYRNLSGLGGADAQRSEIDMLRGGPQFGSLVQQGEDAILQNASATGGLRGGNTQGALAEYRTNVLSGLIDKQLGRYGGLISIGQNSAAGTGNAAMQTGVNNSNLMQQQGAAQAGGIVAGTNAVTQALGGAGGYFAARGWQPSTAVPAATGYGGAGMDGGGGFGTGIVYGNQDYGQYF